MCIRDRLEIFMFKADQLPFLVHFWPFYKKKICMSGLATSLEWAVFSGFNDPLVNMSKYDSSYLSSKWFELVLRCNLRFSGEKRWKSPKSWIYGVTQKRCLMVRYGLQWWMSQVCALSQGKHTKISACTNYHGQRYWHLKLTDCHFSSLSKVKNFDV